MVNVGLRNRMIFDIEVRYTLRNMRAMTHRQATFTGSRRCPSAVSHAASKTLKKHVQSLTFIKIRLHTKLDSAGPSKCGIKVLVLQKIERKKRFGKVRL